VLSNVHFYDHWDAGRLLQQVCCCFISMKCWAAGLAGLFFALGLGLAGMTQPQHIIGFLDILGTWDPRMLEVLASAVLTYAIFYRLARARKRPLLADQFAWPRFTAIDIRLCLGSALFGTGWGLAGYCPGPALSSLALLNGPAWLFTAAMVVGMVLARWWAERPNGRRAGAGKDNSAPR
jgi:uncharacterized membrane protein YedE/YeeE